MELVSGTVQYVVNNNKNDNIFNNNNNKDMSAQIQGEACIVISLTVKPQNFDTPPDLGRDIFRLMDRFRQ